MVERDPLSAPVVPMEPRSYPRPFSSTEHAFQVKWDGVRIVAFVVAGRVRLQNRHLRDRTRQYPEMRVLGEMLGNGTAILDGEMVVLLGGRPSFPRILERDFASDDDRIRRLAKKLPVLYAVFDLLYLDGADLRRRKWKERQELLAAAVREGDGVHLVESFPDGEGLFAAVERHQLEGMVAKRLDSPYVPGKDSDYWLKVKRRQQGLFAIGGYTMSGKRLGAVLLGAYRDGGFYYVGRASSGLTETELAALRAHLEVIDRPAFENPPAGQGKRWVRPSLVAAVEFLEWTEDLKLRAPVIRGFSTLPPSECRF